MKPGTGIIMLLALMACGHQRNTTSGGLVQEKQLHDVKMQLTYIPRCPQQVEKGKPGVAGEDELAFRLRVVPLQGSNTDAKELSYGIDSLFRLALPGDTLTPLLAQRIANGNIGGIEYLIVFNRKPVGNAGGATIVFNDWLFTNTRLTFPVDLRKANNLDAISCNL